MVWARTSDNYYDSPGLAALSDRAFRAHFKAWGYCARNLSDGFVPASVAESFGKREVAELVEHEVWVPVVSGGYNLPDFLVANDSRVTVEARKLRDRLRKDSARNPPGFRSESNGESAGIPGEAKGSRLKSVTTQQGVGSQKTQRQRLLLKAYEALPAEVLYPNGEQLSDSDAIAAYLQQRNGAQSHTQGVSSR